MGKVTIVHDSGQLDWSTQCSEVLDAQDDGKIKVLLQDDTIVTLWQLDSFEEAAEIRDRLVQRIEEGLGNGDVIITIEDLRN